MNHLGCVLFSHYKVTYHDSITCQCFNEVLPKVETLYRSSRLQIFLAKQVTTKPRYLLTTTTCLTRLLSSSESLECV